jgi:RHS repeat-associated protein
VFDARQIARNPTAPVASLRQTYDVLGRRLRVDSADAGVRLTLQDAAGKLLRSWNTRGFTARAQYDAAQRTTHSFVAKGASEQLVGLVSYGEALDPAGPSTNPATPSVAQALNLRGRAHLSFDGAGLARTDAADFKSNVLSASRRLATTYQITPDWSALIGITDPALLEATAALGAETFTTTTQYDALNRVVQTTTPDGSITTPSYNAANLLERVLVDVHGAGNPQVVVSSLDYNARGQRLRCEHAEVSGVASHAIDYEYDPLTFRVTRIRTTRTSDSALLQLLDYTYDPVGNITEMRDGSNWDPVLNSLAASGITGDGRYVYDALYRLLSATGREHPSNQTNDTEPPHYPLPHGSDLQQLRAYVEELSYDEVGNITQMRHLTGPSNSQSWSRRYDYELDNNRLIATSAPGDAPGSFSDAYSYAVTGTNDGGVHGSMVSMPHLAELAWDYADRLQFTSKSAGSGQLTYFTYDASGERVRKVYEHNGLVEERIYLGGYEVYRRHAGTVSGAPQVERQTLHVMDDTRRVAMVETKTADTIAADTTPLDVPRWRYQLDNHLGSSALELTETAVVITYEEYHPYGSTAFHTASGAVSQKRYRYTGKEKDDETGLYYHGARYYAPWLGRWTAADPAGMVDGPNLYRYGRNNPVRIVDPTGTAGEDWRSSLSWTQRAALWLDDKIQASPSARGVVNNLEKRGEALVNAPQALREKYEQEGLTGIGKAVVQGAEHLVVDTAKAAVDVGYYGAKAIVEGDDAALEMAASRATDVVLNVADIVTLADGVGAAKSAVVSGGKAAVQGAKAAATTVKEGLEVAARGGRLVTAEGVVISGKGVAVTAPAGLAVATEDVGKATVYAMSSAKQAAGGGPRGSQGGMSAAASENLRKLGLEEVRLAGSSFNTGRKQLESVGFRLMPPTRTGRQVFLNEKTGAQVFYDSGKALAPGQKPHWHIVDQAGNKYSRSGRLVDSSSGAGHIPAR